MLLLDVKEIDILGEVVMRKAFSKTQLKLIKDNNLLTFVTADINGQPHAVIIEPSKFELDKITIPVVQMEVSRRNVEKNKKCFLHAFIDKGLEDSIQFKIDGEVEIYTEGKLFEWVKKFEEGERLPEGLFVNAIFVVYPTNIDMVVG